MKVSKVVDHEKQVNALTKSAKRCGLDSHITFADKKSDCDCTWANKIMKRWYRKLIPFKNSYMHCESMDMCFFFDEYNEPMYTYAGYAELSRDAKEEKIVKAFRKANLMLQYMKDEMESEVE